MFAVFVVLLKALGAVSSSSSITLESIIGAGILIELGRIETRLGRQETKLGLLWKDFKKRKAI